MGRQRFIEFADEWADSQDTWKQTTADGWPPIRSRLEARVGDMPLVRFDPMSLRRLRADLAKKYAEAGGFHGIEMQDYLEVKGILES